MRRAGALRARILAFVVVFGFGASAFAGAPANPYDKFRNETYDNRGLMSEQDEIRLGQQVNQQALQKYRVVRDPAIAGYVERLGERLARTSLRPNLQYTFVVIDDPSYNAFSLPGGFIYMNTGILQLAQSEDEVAAVLGHEIGHVVARHGIKNYKKAQRTQLIFGGLGAAAEIITRGSTGGRAASAAAQLIGAGILTKNSREFEREADYLGLYDSVNAGYDADGMVRIFRRLGQASGKAQSSIGGIFASHPDSGERVRNTETEIAQHLGSYRAGGGGGPRGGDLATSAGYDPNDAPPQRETLRRGGRRARQDAGAPDQQGYGSSSSFAEMKAALGSPRSSGRGRLQRQGQGRQQQPRQDRGGQNDTYDQPGQYEPPPMRRRPSQP